MSKKEHFLVDIDDEPRVVQALEDAGFEVTPSDSPVGKYEVKQAKDTS